MYRIDRLFTTVFILAVCACSLSAQSAREVLDATAARMTQKGGVKAQFKATQFRGTEAESETTGTILVSGNKFQMDTPNLVTWFDGKTQWSMMKGSDEVNITEPTEEELLAMNPSTLVHIYKKGYRYSMRTSTLRGRPTYEIQLKAKKPDAAFTDIYVDVEQGTFNPLCFRAKNAGDWIRLSIQTFQTGLTHPNETFSFPTKDFPNVEVIDLR